MINIGDAAKRQQIYVVNVYTLLGFLSVTIFGVLHIFVDNSPVVGYAELLGGAAMLLILLLLKLSRSAAFARIGFLSTVLALLAVMLITGGTAGTGIFWFFVFPVSAFFLGGKHEGIWWMTALAAMILAVFLAAQSSLITLSYSPVVIRQLLVTLAVVTVGIYVYQSSREVLARQTSLSEADLAKEKIRASTVLENINEGVVTTDDQGRVMLMNQAAQKMLGWQFSELRGKKFVDLVSLMDSQGQNVDESQRPMVKALTSQTFTNYQLQYKRKNGTLFPVDVAGRPIIADGKVIGAVNTFRDITQELAIDRAKTEFVTLASHQLRTPISAIAWYSEMLLHGDAGKLKPEQKAHVNQIYHSNQRSGAMVDAMLMASMLELGNIKIKPEALDLAALSRQVIKKQKDRLLNTKQLEITEEYDRKLGPVLLDKELIKTVLHNLISNAFKYTPAGGKVAIRITKDDDKTAKVEITDSGLGIPRNQQTKVFTKLFRADNIKKNDTDGTGLGLYIVKMAVEYLGGHTTFRSSENGGTTFTITLPLHNAKDRHHAH